jgi:hypothetical protein
MGTIPPPPPQPNSGRHNPSGVQSAFLASAMQAAQWSINNGYASAGNNINPANVLSTKGKGPGGVFGPPAVAISLWPSNFETHGSAYVFQPKTGYFLDPLTEFYYCPKSKLYYNAKDGVYYRWDTTVDPPFKKFEPPMPTEPELTTAAVGSEAGDLLKQNSSEGTAGEKKISVAIKMKVKAVIPPAKKIFKEIAKWEAIQKEEEEEEEAAAAQQEQESNNANSVFVKRTEANKTPAKPSTTGGESSTTTPSEDKPLVPPRPSSSEPSSATIHPASNSDGQQPVCLLCQRKFPSFEILVRHEKESKLHMENLAKQKEQQQAQQLPQYRDRAEERREKYGSVPDHLPHKQQQAIDSKKIDPSVVASLMIPAPGLPMSSSSSASHSRSSVAVHDDHTNPGNSLLRKMGWQEGKGLGKEGNEGKETAVGVELADRSSQQTSMHETIRRTSGSGGRGGGGGGGGSGNNYKDSVYAASRSRFEQLTKNEQK